MENQSTYFNRKNRRMMLKNAGYFEKLKNETFSERAERITNNIKNGNKLHNEHLDRVMKMQEAVLMDRESKYRALLKELNYTNKEIDKAINEWYDTIFKD